MKVLVFIGPSGSGKSTLLRELYRRGEILPTPSWTTRPRRRDEADDLIDHRFVTARRFSQLQEEGFFLEVIEMFGFRYGLPPVQPPVDERIPVISVRAELLDLVSKHFPDHVVYQFESTLQTASERVEARQSPALDVERRLRAFDDEVALGRLLAHRRFDTSGPLSELADLVGSAIAEDFQIAQDGLHSIGTTGERSR